MVFIPLIYILKTLICDIFVAFLIRFDWTVTNTVVIIFIDIQKVCILVTNINFVRGSLGSKLIRSNPCVCNSCIWISSSCKLIILNFFRILTTVLVVLKYWTSRQLFLCTRPLDVLLYKLSIFRFFIIWFHYLCLVLQIFRCRFIIPLTSINFILLVLQPKSCIFRKIISRLPYTFVNEG